MDKSKIIIIATSVICIIGVILGVLILGDGVIYKKYKCPDSTYKLENKRCKKTDVLDSYNKLICPTGFEAINDTCKKVTTEASKIYYTCDKGYKLVNQSCVKTTVINRTTVYKCLTGTQSPDDESKCLVYSEPSVKTEGTKKVKYCTEKQGVLKGDNCIATSNATSSQGCPTGYTKTAKQTCTKEETIQAKINRTCDSGYTLEEGKCIKTEIKAGTYEEACKAGYTLKDGKCYLEIDVVATRDSLF